MTLSPTCDALMQERVFAFLTDPKSHCGVTRIDTHAASVFLEGDRALKIKRAVRFPFLDYSTLQRRKAACDEELRINRHFAPQIYRRVVPITEGADGSLSLDGNGSPVEYAIEMVRFDEQKTLDHIARAACLDPDLVEAIADAIAASHAAAPRVAPQSWLKSIPKIIDDNDAALRACALFDAGDAEELREASLTAFSRLRPRLEQRGGQGHVRRCHGDLHLANIVVIAEKPVLFDAIEFDPKIAEIDVLYDLSFPLMDLLRHGRREAANGLLNRYLAVTSVAHLDALSALPLLMSIRAAIRAHVLSARIDRAGPEKAAIVADARAYFDLAKRLIHPRPPLLIAVGGLSGTGKSRLARALAPHVMPEPGAVVLRSDVVRKQLVGVAEKARLPEGTYGPQTSRQIYDILSERAGHILAQRHSAILDAVFASAAERKAVLEVAQLAHSRFFGLFLVADLKIREQRISQRTSDASDATVEVARLQEGYDIGTIDWAIVDASGAPEETLRECQKRIAAVASL